ncbi:hypothetical protein HZS_2296, partial [Henneguya salminicola]
MTRISTIIPISLILSYIDNIICVTVEPNISYKFQYNYAPILDPIFHTPLDIESIVQSSKPTYFDISIAITKYACGLCEANVNNLTRYIELLIQSASRVIYFFAILN